MQLSDMVAVHHRDAIGQRQAADMIDKGLSASLRPLSRLAYQIEFSVVATAKMYLKR